MVIHFIKLKTLIMRKLILILIAAIGINFYLSAQSAGDYRSVGNGNWNDATKWEAYNGSTWVSTSTYPGQNTGTGTVTIMHPMEIKITASIPHPIANLAVISDYLESYDNSQIVPSAVLTFSAEIASSLYVSGDVDIKGILKTENRNGAKTHILSIGRNLHVGVPAYFYDCDCFWGLGELQTIALDDKINVTFNTTDPTSRITGPLGINFYDVTFNGTGIIVATPISISGTATFIYGIVTVIPVVIDDGGNYYHLPGDYGGSFAFNDGAGFSGGSNVSHIVGLVSKSGDDPFTFPIGSAGVYAPLTISAPGGPETYFAGYGRSPVGFDHYAISDPDLYSVSNCEVWILYARDWSTNFLLDVTVGWTPASGCASSPGYISNASEVRLAYTEFNGNWTSHDETGTGTISNGSVSMSGVAPSGYFTLGNVVTNCRPPSDLTTSNISSNSAIVEWTAETNAVSYDLYYKFDYQTTWTNAITSITSTSVSLSGLSPLAVYNWKVRANCGSSSSLYRQGQFKTIAACGTPTGLSATNITTTSSTLNWSAVPNAINYTIEYRRSGANSPIATVTGINSLSYNLSGLSASTEYNWVIRAFCAEGGGLYAQSYFTTLQAPPPPPPPPVCNDVYEFNNTSSQARAISLGVAISAGISSASDIDWFKVTTPNNSNTNLDVMLSNLIADYDLYVYNKSLKLIGSSINTGTSNEVVIYNSNARKATYYIKVLGKGGAFNTSQCYNLVANVFGSGGRTASHASAPANEVTEGLNKQFLYPNPASEFVYLMQDWGIRIAY